MSEIDVKKLHEDIMRVMGQNITHDAKAVLESAWNHVEAFAKKADDAEAKLLKERMKSNDGSKAKGDDDDGRPE